MRCGYGCGVARSNRPKKTSPNLASRRSMLCSKRKHSCCRDTEPRQQTVGSDETRPRHVDRAHAWIWIVSGYIKRQPISLVSTHHHRIFPCSPSTNVCTPFRPPLGRSGRMQSVLAQDLLFGLGLGISAASAYSAHSATLGNSVLQSLLA
jgi:hypothetical protein